MIHVMTLLMFLDGTVDYVLTSIFDNPSRGSVIGTRPVLTQFQLEEHLLLYVCGLFRFTLQQLSTLPNVSDMFFVHEALNVLQWILLQRNHICIESHLNPPTLRFHP